MSVILIGGIENLRMNYINNAQREGINLKVFTGHERQVGSKIGNPDAIIVLTRIISHAAKIEVSKKANSQGVPIVYQKLTGLSNLQECFKTLVKTHKNNK